MTLQNCSDGSNISNFYSGKTVLITGFTGFMGKVLAEKLLRSCSGINKIIVLLRKKKFDSIHERLKHILNSELFDELKKENSNFSDKILAMEADFSKKNLNIFGDELRMLKENVNVIFHLAAVTKFSLPLVEAIRNNLFGTYNVITLAKDMKNLQALVHVSTAYVYCLHKVIEEKPYQFPVPVDSLLELLNEENPTLLSVIEKETLAKWPNTYTFTKAATETLLNEQVRGLPVAIFRPCIVSPTLTEPVPGWMENYNGTVGITASVALGFIKVGHASQHTSAQAVPCDLSINYLIATAWDIATHRSNEIVVYNYGSESNRITRKKFLEYTLKSKYYLERAVWYPSMPYLFESEKIYSIGEFIFHSVPAFLFDRVLNICGQKSRIAEQYDKVNKGIRATAFFLLRDWEITEKNTEALWHKLSDQDKAMFNFNIHSVNWETYLDQFVRGIKVYMLKENLSNLDKARYKRKWLKILNYGFMFTIQFVLFIFWYILINGNLSNNIFSYLLLAILLYAMTYLFYKG